MRDLGDLGENGIIQLFSGAELHEPVIKGIGDDCAVIRGAKDDYILLTTDMMVEGIHFEKATCPAYEIGWKSLAVNLSDIAAMGGQPEACLLAISLPGSLQQTWLVEFRDGWMAAANRYGCQVIGGDTCGSSSGIAISVTVYGRSAGSKVLWRFGASDGDDVWVSGAPGMSALGLLVLQESKENKDVAGKAAVAKHLTPEPQLELGRFLAVESLASSCIDTSDGIATDLGHICAASHLGAIIEEELFPLPDVPPSISADPTELALYGGEDYDLLFTAPNKNRRRLEEFGNLHRIGIITSDVRGVVLLNRSGEQMKIRGEGFRHFKSF